MAWKQVVAPNLGTKDGPGWCLRFTQTAFSAPVRFPTARVAWDGQTGRHFDTPPRGVAVPIWFDHWGNYGSPAYYDNWGHVAVWLGDGRVLSSPLYPTVFGQVVFASMDAMARALGGNTKYLGWSEFMNGRRIVLYEAGSTTSPGTGQKEDDEMKNVGFWYYTDGTKKTVVYMLANLGSGFVNEYGNGPGNGPMPAAYNNPIAATLATGSFAEITASHANALKASLALVRAGKA